MVKAQEWINSKFPTKESKEKVKVLLIGKEWAGDPDPIASGEGEFSFPQMFLLEGELDLNEFINLEEVVICTQYITSLRIDKLGDKLIKVWVKSTTRLRDLYLADYPNFLFLDFYLESNAELKIITPQLTQLKQENKSLREQLKSYQEQFEVQQEQPTKN